MPDTTTEVKFNPIDRLAYGAKKPVFAEGTPIPEEIQKAQKRGSELRDIKEKNGIGKKIFENLAGDGPSRRFGKLDAENLILSFGAGEGKIEDGKPTIPEKIDAKRNFEDAQREVTKLSNLLLYSEVENEIRRTGKSAKDILRERSDRGEKVPPSDEWDKFQNQTLDDLLAQPFMHENFPPLYELADVNLRRQFVKHTLVTDPRLAQILSTRLSRLTDEMSTNLTSIEKDAELKQAEEIRASTEKGVNETFSRMLDQLDTFGLPLNDVSRERIKHFVQEGKTIEYVMTQLRRDILTEDRFPHSAHIEEYGNLKQELRTLNEFNPRGKLDSVISDSEARREEVKTRIEELEGELKPYGDEIRAYSTAISILTTTKDPSTQAYRSSVAQELNEALGLRKKGIEAETTIREKEPKAKEKEAMDRRNRLRKESEHLGKLEHILVDSVDELFSERHAEMNQLEDERQRMVNEQAEKEKTETVAGSIKTAGDRMKKRWIEYDEKSRKRKVHGEQIGKDVRRLAYEGEDGIKRLLLRELSDQEPFAKITKGDGGEITVEKMDWESVDLAELSEEQQHILNEVSTQHADALKTKLFRDFFVARGIAGPMDRAIFGRFPLGNLALRDFEWRMLDQNFHSFLETQVNARPEAKAAIEDMKKKGIKPDINWLMFLLMLPVGAVQAFNSGTRKVSNAWAGI